MTVRAMAEKESYHNPQNLPLEILKLTINNDGICRTVPALDPHWVEKRTLCYYRPPPKEKNSILGALQTWKDSTQWFVDDLKWLLSLDCHKFWSNVLYHSSVLDMLVSFLQEAYPPYLPQPQDKSVMELYNQAYRRVFVVFSRLITTEEAPDKWINSAYLGDIIYEKYIFTIPIVWDLCLIYGTTNKTHINKMLNFIFKLQPKYYDDLKIAISFLKQVYEFIASRLDNKLTKLPEPFKGFTKNFSGLQSKLQTANTSDKLNWSTLQDYILHILDSAVTMRLFLEIHEPARKTFRENDFHMSIVNFYENTIPKMYEKVQELGSSIGAAELDAIHNHLEIMRTELIDAYRSILYSVIEDIMSNRNIEENINTYLTILTDSLSEKAFMKDYNLAYPVEADLDILCQAYKNMDPLKCDFILEAVMSNYDELPPQKSKYTNNVEEKSHPMKNGFNEYPSENLPSGSQQQNAADIPEEAKTQSLISEVKDILPNLGDGYILRCLQHYKLDAARVINCILEGTLDDSLQRLDPQLPIIPEEKLGKLFSETGIERLNIYDFDEFDVMNRDDVDVSRIHKGKKKSEHKNLSAMLNDKSYVKGMKEKYVKYSVVSDDDEYDDTYDDSERNIVSEASAEADRRLNTKSVSFRDTYECQAESEDEPDEEPSSHAASGSTPSDQFCTNPEELRAKQQARRDAKCGHKQNSRDVVGRARGQGQEKEVLLNRQNKGAHKSQVGNHNRRRGAQFKRNQGML